MSTVREHLGLLWLSRRALMTSNPQYDKAWAEQAALFVGVHLNELIELAGGADIEGWVRERAGEIPDDFPHRAPAPSRDAAPLHERNKCQIEVLYYEREHERAKNERLMKILMAVFNLAPQGNDIHLPDGRVMRFNDPNANETLNALGRAIWSIPERLDEAIGKLAIHAAPAQSIGQDEQFLALLAAHCKAEAADHILNADSLIAPKQTRAKLVEYIDGLRVQS